MRLYTGKAIFKNLFYFVVWFKRFVWKPVTMDGKRRVILIALLATLSLVRGEEFAFSWSGYSNILAIERDGGVEFTTVEKLNFCNTDVVQEWVANIVEEEGTKTLKIIPKCPGKIKTGIVGVENDGSEPELLSYMTMSFAKVSHQIYHYGRSMSYEGFYGKFGLCFNRPNPENDTYGTCVYTHMFSNPKNEYQMDATRNIVVHVNPIARKQLLKIKAGKPFRWSLQSLNGVLAEEPKEVILKIPASSVYSNLAIHVNKCGSAFFLKPIIVEESLLRQYYALVHPRNDVDGEGTSRPSD